MFDRSKSALPCPTRPAPPNRAPASAKGHPQGHERAGAAAPVQRRRADGASTLGGHDFARLPIHPSGPRAGSAAPAPGTTASLRRGDPASAVAAAGVQGGGGALPHLDVIQASFGRHALDSVRAHTGSAASAASAALGAGAYATGSDIAFRASSPDLHTAAHEAAHVIQQRGSVPFAGGLGPLDDVHERHADAVAEQVVQGRSAEALLDRYAGSTSIGGGAPGVIQRRPGDPPRGPPPGGSPLERCRQDGDPAGELLCLEVLDQRIDEKLASIQGDPITRLKAQGPVIALREQVFRRKRQLERQVDRGRRPEPSASVVLLGMLYGPALVAPIVRPEYRDQLVGASIGRLAVAGSALAIGKGVVLALRELAAEAGPLAPAAFAALNKADEALDETWNHITGADGSVAGYEPVEGIGPGPLTPPTDEPRERQAPRQAPRPAPRHDREAPGPTRKPTPEHEDILLFERETLMDRVLLEEAFTTTVYSSQHLSVEAKGTIKLHAMASLGAGLLRDLQVSSDGRSGQARLVVPAEVAPDLAASGTLKATGHWKGLPVASVSGTLDAGGAGRASMVIDQPVRVTVTPQGKYAIDLTSGELKAALEAQVSLDAAVQAKLGPFQLWNRSWRLHDGAWSWSKASLLGQWSIGMDGTKPTLDFPVDLRGSLDGGAVVQGLFHSATDGGATTSFPPEIGGRSDPFEIDWKKPASAAYPALYLGGPTATTTSQATMKQLYATGQPDATGAPVVRYDPHVRKALPTGETLGVAGMYQVQVGRVVGPVSKATTPGGAKINNVLKKYGFSPDLERRDGDHIRDIQFGGVDALLNLWPLDQGINRGTGHDQATVRHPKTGVEARIPELKEDTSREYYLRIRSTL